MEKVTVFLGGTCADSTWREELIPMLDSETIETFNPVVPDWTPECQEVERFHRATDDICLYVITPEGEGFTSFVEVTDDSNKRPSRTILCILDGANGQFFTGHIKKCADYTIEVVEGNGVLVFYDLESLANYLNLISMKKTKMDEIEPKIKTKTKTI